MFVVGISGVPVQLGQTQLKGMVLATVVGIGMSLMAWIVERLLQEPPVATPKAWPGLDTVGERAREIARAWDLYDYQYEGAAFLASRDWAILADAPGVG